MNLNISSSKYHELMKIISRLKQIEHEKLKMEFEIKKYESYYTQNTKFGSSEIDCIIANIAVDYDLLLIEERELLNRMKTLSKELEGIVSAILKENKC